MERGVRGIAQDRPPSRPLLVGVKLSVIVLVFMGLFQAAPALAASGADIGVTKSGPATVAPNTNITYTITYANNGPAAASTVSMTDTLPAGETLVDANFFGSPPPTSCGLGATISCSTSTMPNGSSVGLTVTTHVASSVADLTVLSNTASVSSSAPEIDPNSANNSSTAATLVTTGTGTGGGGGGGGGGGPNPSDTPELDSLLLFGSGLSGLAGYAALRLRTRRRRT
jgi:uncharacterized repeat protein (TIGR01451 family)